MLKDVLDVCEKQDLPCFLIYGTAIGAVRHQGFIPWDDDIDVGMLRKDYDRLMEIFDKELGEHYELCQRLILVMLVQLRMCNVKIQFYCEMTKDLKCNCRIFMDPFLFDSNHLNLLRIKEAFIKKINIIWKAIISFRFRLTSYSLYRFEISYFTLWMYGCSLWFEVISYYSKIFVQEI